MKPEDREHRSVSIEKIENGYLRHETHSQGDQYSSKTTYHNEKPSMEPHEKPEKDHGKMLLRAAKKLLKVLVLGLGLSPSLALAQQPVQTLPSPPSSVHNDGTITVTNTFQSVFAQSGQSANPSTRPRQGCLIQNTGSNPMWVFAGPIASATKNTSFQLVPVGTGVQGGSFSCSTGAGGAIQDQISITGTSGDTFAATQQ
jgi:hypothetical protein